MKSSRHGVSIPRTALVVVAALPFVYPFVFLVGLALKPLSEFNQDPVGLPTSPTFSNLRGAWTEAGLGDAMVHSLIAVGLAVVVTVGISACGGYWFYRHRGRPAKLLLIALIGTMALPAPVFIIPLFVLLADYRATDNLVVLALVYAGANSSFGLYLVYTFLIRLPGELAEAASVDGASTLQLFTRVLLPLSRPVLTTLAVLAFVWSWSDLLIAVVLVQDPGRRLLTPATALLSDQYSTEIPKEAAAVLIALLPMLIVFLLGQRSLVRGIVSGVGK
jgi:raffinose/stachyose/melibiose transport system permease protein